MRKINAIVYYECGEPAAVARFQEWDLPDCGPDEVEVRMLMAPINPADLNTLEGKYPGKPALPAVPGAEGVGEVVQAGADVTGFEPGTRVLVMQGVGTWREGVVTRPSALIPVPEGLPVEQAAMLVVNPPTAWRLLHGFVDLQPGQWVLQNAANSGVGTAVIQIARSLGWRTVNVVRRPELAEPLLAQGADVVVCDGDRLVEEIREQTANAPIRLALNAVGGDSALKLANSLARSGTLVTYGAMSRQPLRIPNGLLIFKDLRFRGLWVTQWLKEGDAGERRRMFDHLFAMVRSGALTTRVSAVYPAAEITRAITHASQERRDGKILIRF